MLSWLEYHWYRLTPLHFFLWPVSLIFALLVLLRRFLYRQGWLASQRLPVPVIIVGNFVVGGAGKTPLVIWLADFLTKHGFHPGILSRGYGVSVENPTAVKKDSDATEVGDEPLLLAKRTGCPVWIHPDRVWAGQELLKANPQCNVLICDDGLQHYRLQRDMEIAVVDVSRGYGNGLMLPAGPLREPKSRAQSVDAVIWHDAEPSKDQTYWMALKGLIFVNLADPHLQQPASAFQGKKIQAMAGIGNPQRFFKHLMQLGLQFEARVYPDHYQYQKSDIDFPNAEVILMTEKDAVKCAKYADKRYWALVVDAEVSAEFAKLIMEKIDGR
jgi:tetraacyldisaccharide 4'-kinase